MRNDDGHRLVGILRGVNADVGDEETTFINRFKSFKGNVLESKHSVSILDYGCA